MENVSWGYAQAYIAKLNQKGEGTYALPTEAQWEYAARAGSTTAFYNGHITEPEGNDPNLDVIGWYDSNSDEKTHPVAQKDANFWGLYDMSGNVWEWCLDWYDYASGSVTDPTGPFWGYDRVIRGGSWGHNAGVCRSAYRSWFAPGHGGSYLGFRLARAQ